MRKSLLLAGLIALAAPGATACSGDDTEVPLGTPSSDGGPDATAIDANSDARAADGSPESGAVDAGGPDIDAATDAPNPPPPDGGDNDAGNAADAGDATDAADAALPVRTSVRLVDGTYIAGVTADDQVVYWSSLDAGSLARLSAIPATGGTPQVLSSTALATAPVAVAGSTAVWEDKTGADAGACPLASQALYSWSSAHGVKELAPFAAVSGQGRGPAVNADGSKVAYLPGCDNVAVDAGGGWSFPTIALASTDGAGSPLLGAISDSPFDFRLYLNGATVTMDALYPGSSPALQAEFAGDPLVETLSGLESGLWQDPTAAWVDPSGTWIWSPATGTDSGTGMQLRRASDGQVVFTDPTAYSGAGNGNVAYGFDAAGANLLYGASAGVKHLALASPTTPVTLAGCEELIAAAPNGASAACISGIGTPNVAYLLVTTGVPQTTVTLPSPGLFQFLPDSTLIWLNGTTLFAVPGLGGPVSTMATSVSSYASLGGSQVAVFQPSGVEVIDAEGKIPAFKISPTPPSAQGLFAPASGGLVAYALGGAIYAVPTK